MRRLIKLLTERMSITMNNTTQCSGGCLYCCWRSNSNGYWNKNYTEDMLRHIDDQMFKQWKYNPEAIQKTLEADERMMKADRWSIDIWGADPVTNFSCLQELVVLLRNIAKDNKKKLIMSTSTNGLPLMRNDITEWLLNQNDLSVQLSHDGLGQSIRTGDWNPLSEPNVVKLIRAGKMTAINCTLNFWNYSLFANMNYFNKYLKEMFPEVWIEKRPEWIQRYRRLYIKLNHIYDGQYDVKAKHPVYDVSLGDMSLHNDENFPIPKFRRVLDNYIDEWFKILSKDLHNECNYLEYMPYMKYIREQFQRGKNISKYGGNKCRQFQMGVISKGDHMDSTGRYCQCNLIDADHSVANPSNDRESYCEECKTCKYKNSGECNMCGSLLPRSKCQYYYRWNQFLEVARHDYKPQRIK